MASSSKTPSPTRGEYPSPPPCLISESFSYDVFLSFRGRDTRNNFTGHLYQRLVEAGIRTFMDDPQLRRGSEISQQLMRAIEESRIYIVVFSQNYASSRWCLDELVKIINMGRVLLPVFYGVQPSDVRWLKGSFKQAFRNHEAYYINQPDMVQTWRDALIRASGYSGFDLQSSALGSESRLISLIIKEVLSLVKPRKLFVAKYPVGMRSRVNDVCSLIRLESDYRVQFIGIWGMGGSGKTVIAKALYNKILQSFDSSCFLADVRENSKQPNGLVHLQEKLISSLLMRENVKVDNVCEGIEMMRERFCFKKVLIVLDDAEKLTQVDSLAGQRNWFAPGSIVIITTRDQHLLNHLQVDGRYEANKLNSEESLELFSWHSFKKRNLEEPYTLIAQEIISYCCGLPLALEVLGSFLFGRTIQQWGSEFEKVQQIPPTEIQEILKISYDGLDYQESEIFLDIAFFFIGMDIDYVTEIINGCGFSTEIAIGILKDRCLLTINKNNELRMHDLLRDMGREIIRKQYPREPGKRSRLWSHQDATYVLKGNKGTEAIEGVNLSPREEEIHLDTRKLARLCNLRLLKMDNVSLDGDFKDLPKEITWIRWQGCSLKNLPFSFELSDLVVIDMQHSKMIIFWDQELYRHPYSEMTFMVNMKILNLSHSKGLISTPDLSKVPRLVKLILEGCTRLVMIDPSIGFLGSLLVLNMKGCEEISNIPSEICSLRLLGYLNLSGCSNLRELPQNIGKIESLREIYADETAITQLPSSFVDLKNLTNLSLRGCTQMSGNENSLLGIMPRPPVESRSLRRLNLRDCNLSGEHIPYNIGYLSGLLELDLAGNSLNSLPDTFRLLMNLESLSLDDWSILPLELAHLKPTSLEMPDLVVLDMQHSEMNTVWQELEFLTHLKVLNLSHSKYLKSTPDFTNIPSLVTLILEGCTSLLHIDPSIGCLDSLLVLNLKSCENITYIPTQICRLRLLTYLNLSGCSIEELPGSIGEIGSLRELYADETSITQLPESFINLKNLTSLSLKGCSRMSAAHALILLILMSFSASNSLQSLNLRECNLSDDDFPHNIGELSALEELDLGGNSFNKLPDSFSNLTNLKSITLDNWSILPPKMGHLKPTSDNMELTESVPR